MKQLFLVFSILFSVKVLAQKDTARTRFDIDFDAIPSLSTFNTAGKFEDYKYIYPLNYGIRISFKKQKLIFSAGILHLTQGTKLAVLGTSSNNPQGAEYYFYVFFRIKAIAIPINVDYILISKNKTEVFAGLGLYSGYIYSQQQENTSIPKNYLPPSNVIYAGGAPTRFTDVNIFDKYYFAENVDIAIRHFFNKYWGFQFRPSFLFQIKGNLPSNKYAWTNRLMTFSFDTGLFFNLNSQTKKE